ncbi:DNA methyltransferase [Flavobacterium sp. WC2429]|uniref:site-specific DNA-methyltransferase (adenine-specific) n=1 Tax=Flavobacterium sp. WC2429 TaxID=3234140 RepID=A0AB39WK70_9FLAO
MSLFQPSVLKKYLSQQDTALVQKAYKKYTKYFHNAVIQENIRNSKEEQFQEGFLRELFVDILGYTLNPAPSFNLTTELKNIKGAKKVDGAILKDGNALGVIELKGTNTKDLESIRQQAFDYKANQTGCIYVITSNFEKLRFYINNAVDYEEFNLFTLTHAEFEIFYLCLAKENILANKPLSIKEASVVEEENITKKFYGDYSVFKRELYRDLVKQNRSNILLKDLSEKTTKLTLFKKSQKLIDRFLFILFAEDRGLLAPNSINTVLKEWKALADLDVEVPLYDRYKQYFGYLDTGRKGTEKKEEIFAYNGGLFQPDAILDAIIIDNDLLYRHTLKLSTYDFESQVDVNILGHIFEHSLNEIESVNAEIEGTDFDKQKTKRKKDGVFYTPKYITKYIVDNTIGKLCAEKKQELGIIDEEYAKGRKNRQATTIIKLDQQLKDYREWLLRLTICDPACGSGAFLNQALDFLIKEHAYLDELNKQLFGGFFVFPDIENQILEHNIYGVDLNEESIEIAKLSLWLRTAQPKRKLTSLNNNIKCGNSLIESKAVAGDKAFNWKEQFPEVFAKGGFDVIIGNPPYVQLQTLGKMSDILKNCGYETFDKGGDIYCLFTERGYKLLKKGGIQSFIMPNKWMLVAYGKSLRKFLSKTGLCQVLNFGDIQFFEEATTYVCIFITQKNEQGKYVEVVSLNKKNYHNDFLTEIKSNIYDYPSSKFDDDEWSIQPYSDALKLERMKLNGIELKNLPVSIYRGILTGYNDAFYINEQTRQQLISADANSDEIIKPMVRGRDILAYGISDSEFLINVHNGIKVKNPPLSPIIIDDYPAIKNHLDVFYPMLQKRSDKGDTPYNLRNCAYLEEFTKPKIIYPNMTSIFPFMFNENGMLANQKCFILTAQDDSISLPFLTAVFNSSLAKLWIWYKCPELQGGTREISKVYFENFPVPKVNNQQTAILAHYATDNIFQISKLQEVTGKFHRTLHRKFELKDLPKKLQDWHLLSYAEFIKELVKKKVKLSLSQEAEWEDYFISERKKALDLKAQIDATDKEIDTMVYELYGLSEEEINIVESSN